ncbi:MAG: hypothetical protein IJ568_00825 [Bacilli bacterium]|nr:hypothetical protein [Bacilli bacterium]
MKSNTKYKKKNNDKSLISLGIIAVVSIALILSFLTVGFALYSRVLNIHGEVGLKNQGTFRITSVTKTTSTNTDNQVPSFTDDSVNFNLNFVKSNEENPVYEAVYDIVFTNDTFYDRTISDLALSFTANDGNGVSLGDITVNVTGLESGDVVPKLSSKTATVSISFVPTVEQDNYQIEGGANVESNEKPDGNILATLNNPTTGNIKNGRIASFSANVVSTYANDVQFELYPVSNKIEICDQNGNPLSPFTISANNPGENYTFYVKAKDDAEFPNDTFTTSIVLKSTGLPNVNLGSITLDVDKQEEFVDTSAPIISNVVATISDTIGEVNLSWNGEDESGIASYTIVVCDGNGTAIRTINTNSDSTSYTVTGLSNGAEASNYIFKVYGTDVADPSNTASSTDIENATTDAGTCSRTDSAPFQWVFNITVNINNGSSNGPTTVNINNSYSGTLRANNNYSLPNSITVTMGGRTLSASEYTYTQSNGNVSISKVTGDVVVTARCTWNGCLIEGTKIMLADGTYKNIEDINYTDLLAVWSYDTGSIDYEYPIWIENEDVTYNYQITTFNDGSILKTAGYHGVFDVKNNQFISVDDKDKFKVGTEIYKIENGKLKSITVTKIEEKYEDIKFYHVVSSRYYNIIANDILTTDGTVVLSNLYGFDDNIKWPNLRKILISDKNNLYSYKELEDVLPYYMFVGLRAEEGKILSNYGLDLNLFKGYLSENQSKKGKYLEVNRNRKGNRLFMVTTSQDIINNLNKNNYLKEEGSIYTIPYNSNAKCYLNSVDKKCYKSGEKIVITSPIYFKVIY